MLCPLLGAESCPTPVQRSETTSIVVDEERAVCFEHQQADGFGEPCRETTCVLDLTPADEQAHGPDRTVRFGQFQRISQCEVSA
jgi:hypothetical protein